MKEGKQRGHEDEKEMENMIERSSFKMLLQQSRSAFNFLSFDWLVFLSSNQAMTAPHAGFRMGLLLDLNR